MNENKYTSLIVFAKKLDFIEENQDNKNVNQVLGSIFYQLQVVGYKGPRLEIADISSKDSEQCFNEIKSFVESEQQKLESQE